jgi:hypothetical protein
LSFSEFSAKNGEQTDSAELSAEHIGEVLGATLVPAETR